MRLSERILDRIFILMFWPIEKWFSKIKNVVARWILVVPFFILFGLSFMVLGIPLLIAVVFAALDSIVNIKNK